MTDTPEAVRLEFERYFLESRKSKGTNRNPTFERFEDGTYKDDHTQRHWWTWQNALLRRIPELEAENAAWRKQAEHWHRLYLEKCQQYNDRVAQLVGVIEGLEAEAAQGEVANVPLAWQTTREGLLAYVLQDDLHNRLTPRVIDIAYTAFMYGARGRNTEDGSQCDWFNDTKPAIEKAIAKLRKDLFEASNAPTQPAAGADVLKNDARYQWLRSQDDDDFVFAVVKNPHFDVYESPEELDAAIDAAIAASGRHE